MFFDIEVACSPHLEMTYLLLASLDYVAGQQNGVET